MCGIVGWISSSLTDRNQAISEVARALTALRPRGPEGRRVESGKRWFLGHTRLSILDLSEKASQPMTDGRGSWLVYNGEIYNFKELREELKARGYKFHSSGDTEVLLHAMREWGIACLERLRGMFAFGWLNSEKRELILCRDRYGVKPLAYEIRDKDFRFASDLHALRLLPKASREIDSESAYLYMALGYVPAPHSILKNVRKVKPGHYLHVRWSAAGDLSVNEHCYWSMGQIQLPQASLRGGEADEAISKAGLLRPFGARNDTIQEEFEKHLNEAIRYRLVSDVPVGVLLSGGIDSSLVTAICREQNHNDIPSFTLGFEYPKIDEAPFARTVAKHLGGQHEEFYIREEDVLKVWEKLWQIYDEPFADSSALPMVALCRLVADRVKVALSGDGGDEIFAGYPWHRALDRLNHSFSIPKLFRPVLAGVAASLTPSLHYQADVFNQADRVAQWSALRTGLTDATVQLLPVEGASERAPLSDYFREWSKELESVEDPLEWACRMDLLTYLPDDLMVKSDRASMSVGLEMRGPLLDHRMTAWCLGLPIANRYDRKTKRTKLLPRQALERRIPKNLFDRPKRGFVPPLNRWLKGPLQPIKIEAIKRLERGDLTPLHLPAQYRTWSECSTKLNDLHQQFLWRVICFSEWLKHHQFLC